MYYKISMIWYLRKKYTMKTILWSIFDMQLVLFCDWLVENCLSATLVCRKFAFSLSLLAALKKYNPLIWNCTRMFYCSFCFEVLSAALVVRKFAFLLCLLAALKIYNPIVWNYTRMFYCSFCFDFSDFFICFNSYAYFVFFLFFAFCFEND